MCERISSLKVALFTGGIDKHYAAGLSKSLASIAITVDLICNSEMDLSATAESPNLNYLPLYPTPQWYGSRVRKLRAYLWAYCRLIRYAATSPAPIFHILWNYKFPLFDRTVLLVYYKLLGKRIAFTAHNVNAGARDGADSFLNRLSLRVQYRLMDHIFVHTEKMKDQLVQLFGVREERVTIIPFGTYDMVPQSALTVSEAKQRLGLHNSDRTILFFGRIVPYKGIDLLFSAFERIALRNPSYRLVIAGETMKESDQQWRQVQRAIEQSSVRDQVIQHIRFIDDHDIELYLKGADVLALPYREIFQSGVLFMAFSFGLPVIATDVGSFRHDIATGVTGYVCRPEDPADLASAFETYFTSELYRELDVRRIRIKDSVQASHSWEIAASKTVDVYAQLSACKNLQYST